MTGLSEEQVRERKQKGLQNLPVDQVSKTVGQIIAENILTFFNLIFTVLAICLILVHHYKQMLFMIAVAVNAVIGIVQQLRSKRVIDRLSLLEESRYPVIRDGVRKCCHSSDLVQGDIVCLHAGDQIPADAEVREGELRVSEALLTGEADAVRKPVGAELRSGSFVLSGQAAAELTHVGADSYAAKLTAEAKRKGVGKQSEMMKSLDALLHVIAILLVPLGLLLFWKQHWIQGLSVSQATVAVIAAMVGMIPEGLYLLTSVALALSVMRLGKQGVVVHEMSCIETLARVDVLCVDKTGTITEPQMEVEETVLLKEAVYGQEFLEELLGAFYTAMEPDNETAAAIRRAYGRNVCWECENRIPFQSASKWSAVIFREQGSFLIGAPDTLLPDMEDCLRRRVETYTGRGARVVLAAKYQGTPEEEKPLTASVEPIALIVIANDIRETASKTFRYFAEQGVIVKVISGDNPAAAAKVAGQAGIPGADAFVDAQTLKEEEELFRAAEKYTVFGRVTPEQKRLLVEALKKQGHTVAMTGDGVNDVLALKDADCGVAMASGSDAARHAAHLVLMDSDFSAMPQVVAEGRRVTNNIERAAALFLVKNIFSFLLTVILLFAPLTYPLTPIQLTMISGFTIGVPSFFLALEPNKNLIKGRFMNNVMAKAFPGGLTNVAVVLTVSISCAVFRYPVGVMNTMAGISVAFVGLLVLAQVCKPFNTKRFLIWLLMTAAMAVNILLLGPIYSLEPLRVSQWIVLGMIMGAAYPFFLLMKRLVPAVIRVWNRLSGRAERMHS